MKCREATSFLSDYLAGELAGDTLVEFEAHLGRCSNCRVFLEQFRATLRANSEALATSDADARTVMPDELVKGILAAVGKKP